MCRRTRGWSGARWREHSISDTLRYVNATLPPGPRTPQQLQTLRWIVRPTAYMEECRRRYGDSFTLEIANEGKWVFLTQPDAVKQVFTGDPRLLHAGEANVVLLPVLGSHSVLLLDEAAHMRQRKLMLPPFHGDRLRGYADTMREVTQEAIDSWPLGQPLGTRPLMQALTLEIIMRTVFGVQDEAAQGAPAGRALGAAALGQRSAPRGDRHRARPAAVDPPRPVPERAPAGGRRHLRGDRRSPRGGRARGPR